MLGEFKSDQLFGAKTKLPNKLCAANNLKNNKRKQLFQIVKQWFNYSQMMGKI